MKTRKKTKFKRIYWLLISLVLPVVFLVLLLCKPAGYNSVNVAPSGSRPGEVSPYLTHDLLPQLYNGTQRGEPFELVVTQKGINEMVASSKWPKESGGTSFSTPKVFFVPGSIVLMGLADVKGVEFIVTIEVNPGFDQQGLLNLQVAKVKVGAMNITPLAKVVAKRMYQQQLGSANIDRDDLLARVAGSLLNDEPFEPVFKIKDKKVRVEKITITQKKLALLLVPLSD